MAPANAARTGGRQTIASPPSGSEQVVGFGKVGFGVTSGRQIKRRAQCFPLGDRRGPFSDIFVSPPITSVLQCVSGQKARKSWSFSQIQIEGSIVPRSRSRGRGPAKHALSPSWPSAGEGHAFSSRFSSFRKRQSVPSARSAFGLDWIMPISWSVAPRLAFDPRWHRGTRVERVLDQEA